MGEYKREEDEAEYKCEEDEAGEYKCEEDKAEMGTRLVL